MSFSLSPLIVNVISSSFSLFSNLSVYISLFKYVCSNFSIHLLRLVVSFLENDCIDSRNVENKMIFKVAVIFQFISDPSLARLPVRDNIKRRIRMLRQNNQVVREPNDPIIRIRSRAVNNQSSSAKVSTVWHWSWWVNSLIERKMINHFLSLSLGADRILIFASPEQLQVLQSAEHFLVDGTFKVTPEIFYQVFIIHAVDREHVVPVIYSLLRRKDAGTYTRLIDEVVKIAPNWLPASVMMDFEQASINAFKKKFPSVSLSGCYFHLRQSLHRKLQVIQNLLSSTTHPNSSFRVLVYKTNIKLTKRSRTTSTKSQR